MAWRCSRECTWRRLQPLSWSRLHLNVHPIFPPASSLPARCGPFRSRRVTGAPELGAASKVPLMKVRRLQVPPVLQRL